MSYVNNKSCFSIRNDSLELHPSLKREHYSASFLKSWKECPAKTLYSYTCEDKQSSPALDIGTAVHEILEHCYSSEENANLEYALNEAREIDLDDFYKKKVAAYLKAYFSLENEEMRNSEHSTEKELISTLTPLGVELPVVMKGVIDRIDFTEAGSLYVYDYKTTSRQLTDEDYISQMTIYYWLTEEVIGIAPDLIAVLSLYENKPEIIPHNITLERQSRLVDEIFNSDFEIEKSLFENVYEKRRGRHCMFCPARDLCEG